jgi:predicted thioesterase
MPLPGPDAGAVGTARLAVGDADLASRMALEPGEEFPAVLATTRMIGLMELAAARAMRPVLEPGELSVGVVVEVRHTAPTPRGAVVTARARFVGLEGKLYVFDVSAEDEAGEIGRGVHRRAVVDVQRLLAGAARRRTRP